MKKMITILLAFIICLQFAASAQNARVGFSGGVTISDLKGNQNQMNSAAKTGAVFGLLVDLPLTSHLTFQPSLSYIQKGNLNKEDANEKIFYATRYAELSPNFLYHFSSSGKGLYAGAGPYIDFNLPSKKVTDKKEGAKTTTDLTFGETIDKDLRGIDYGVNMLAGFRFSKSVFLSATYGLGIRNLATGEDTGDRKIRNACFGIQIGVLINNK